MQAFDTKWNNVRKTDVGGTSDAKRHVLACTYKIVESSMCSSNGLENYLQFISLTVVKETFFCYITNMKQEINKLLTPVNFSKKQHSVRDDTINTGRRKMKAADRCSLHMTTKM